MAIALANSEIGHVTAASSGSTSGVTTTTGSTFVIATADSNAALNVSDNKGNTYTQLGVDQGGGSSIVIAQMWYCQNGAGGAGHTATVTFTSGTGDCAIYFLEISGAATASYDSAVTAQTDDATSPYEVTSGTPAQADELLVALIGTDGNPTSWAVGGSFIITEQEPTNTTYWASAIAYRIISAAAAATPSWTAGNTLTGTALIVGGFKQAGGGPPAAKVNPISGRGGTAARPLVSN